MDLQVVGRENVGWIHMAQRRVHGNESASSIKSWEFLKSAERLSAFQEGFCFFE
jgi:hypothetical protein